MRRSCKNAILSFTALLVSIGSLTDPVYAQAISEELSSGWFPRSPYQLEEHQGGVSVVTGLDIEISRELLNQAGYRPAFDPLSWGTIVENLQQGQLDFVPGSYKLEERKNFAHFSDPYRYEENAVYYHESVDELDDVKTVDELIGFLETNEIRLAYTEGYAYGSRDIGDLIDDPPSTVKRVPSNSYTENINLAVDREVDIYISNPVIMEKMLIEGDVDDVIRRAEVSMEDIPVHFMFSKKTISKEQVDHFNEILASMEETGAMRSIYINTIIPYLLTLTTGQTWFVLLNLLGIFAFCISGVIIARKERYNFFGAIVLATLPAIGGGVLRDIVLGANKVFILETPEYFLVAVTVVIVGFIGFKTYDYFYENTGGLVHDIQKLSRNKLSGTVESVFKFFDAWAVAAFTIIGVSVAIEMRADPLWLWGPAMGVLTASGGVVLRDMVRADFNIEMLKSDSYAETSIIGGVLFTLLLILFPYQMNPDFIFYLTISFILVLFGVRTFILWSGFENPFQFGAHYSKPEYRLAKISDDEKTIWATLNSYYSTDKKGNTSPVSSSELERLRNEFLFANSRVRDELDHLAAEPLSAGIVQLHRMFMTRMEKVASIEQSLYMFMQIQQGLTYDEKSRVSGLQRRINHCLKSAIESIRETIQSDSGDMSSLQNVCNEQKHELQKLRREFDEDILHQKDPEFQTVLNTSHKAERIIHLISDYVKIHPETELISRDDRPKKGFYLAKLLKG